MAPEEHESLLKILFDLRKESNAHADQMDKEIKCLKTSLGELKTEVTMLGQKKIYWGDINFTLASGSAALIMFLTGITTAISTYYMLWRIFH